MKEGIASFGIEKEGRIENENDIEFLREEHSWLAAFIKNGRLKLFPGCLELFIRLHRRGESRAPSRV